jgi:hypothetical protein
MVLVLRLCQGDHIIAYDGRKYKPAEANHEVGEQDPFVVSALRVAMLPEGSPGVAITDHNPLYLVEYSAATEPATISLVSFCSALNSGCIVLTRT